MGRNQHRRVEKRKETKKRWLNQRLQKFNETQSPKNKDWITTGNVTLKDIRAAGGDLFEIGGGQFALGLVSAPTWREFYKRLSAMAEKR